MFSDFIGLLVELFMLVISPFVFYTMESEHVIVQTGAVCKSLSACLAGEWFLACMYAHVSF